MRSAIAAPASPGDSMREDLVSALANLGYHRQAIDKVLDKLLAAAASAKAPASQAPRFEDVLRAALKDLSRA
jgi:Holliday junction resolvasome RuvABC DNA-binding subunit